MNPAQRNTLAALALSRRLLREASTLAERFEAAVADPRWEPSPKELSDLLLAISRVNSDTSAMFAELAALELDVLGPAPKATSAQPMTFTEAIVVLRAGERTLVRIRRQALRAEH